MDINLGVFWVQGASFGPGGGFINEISSDAVRVRFPIGDDRRNTLVVLDKRDDSIYYGQKIQAKRQEIMAETPEQALTSEQRERLRKTDEILAKIFNRDAEVIYSPQVTRGGNQYFILILENTKEKANKTLAILRTRGLSSTQNVDSISPEIPKFIKDDDGYKLWLVTQRPGAKLTFVSSFDENGSIVHKFQGKGGIETTQYISTRIVDSYLGRIDKLSATLVERNQEIRDLKESIESAPSPQEEKPPQPPPATPTLVEQPPPPQEEKHPQASQPVTTAVIEQPPTSPKDQPRQRTSRKTSSGKTKEKTSEEEDLKAIGGSKGGAKKNEKR